MKQNKSISLAKIGMQRDNHPSQLQQSEYTLAVNTNTNSEVGDGYNVQLEPSNYLGVIFPDGYKVIGQKTDLLKQKTYYFLVNTEQTNTSNTHYKRSSIGFVDFSNLNSDNYNNTQTISDCGDCNTEFNVLTQPLESIEQTPSLTYVELLHDRCISLANLEEEGLNFDINFPVKKIEINQEKLGTTLYWEDYRNTPRYLNVTELEEKGSNSYIFEVFNTCEDNTYQECLNVDRLRLFPKHNRMKLKPKEQQIGGNLKMGTYEFWGAYCDALGNEMTQYSTPTNPISIWDESNNIQGQTETDEFTNYAIKLEVENLDTENFKYYKIAVVERNNIANTQSAFLVGIYPTTDNTVLYTHSGSSNDDLYITRGNVSLKKRMDIATLLAVKPNWEKAKGTMVSGDTLFHYGLVQKEEINLQPVFNLFGGLLHAQTSAVSENIYKSAVATSKYKAYPRNEVIPFGIRLLYKDGGYSATFPLVARPLIDGEDDLITEDDINYKSIIDNSSCITTKRNKKWQIYNTAVPFEQLCSNIEENATETTDEVTKTCVIEEVALIPSGYIEITPDEEYYGLENYLNDNPSAIPAVESALEAEYPDDNCTPTFFGDCTEAEKISEENFVGKVINEQTETVYELTETNYVKSVPPPTSLCIPYKRDNSNNLIEDSAMTPFIPCGDKVYKRDSDFLNEDCAYSTDVLNIENPSQFNGSNVILNYAGAETISELLTAYDVKPSTIVGNFNNKLHKKAQFFKIQKNNRDKIVIEITKTSDCNKLDDLPYINQVRYTIYDSCSTSATVLGGKIVDLTQGSLVIEDTSSFPNNFYLAIDSPIIASTIDIDCDPDPLNVTLVTVYKVVPPCGCFSLYTRNIKQKSLRITYDGIRIDKKQEYKSTCTFLIPRVKDCDPIPYRKYKTAYWESTNTYSDNKELWDSSNLKIESNDLVDLSITDKKEFLDYFVQGGSLSPVVDGQGFYVLNDVDLRCKPIRHHKMPDNTTAPFVIDNINFKNNADSIIFPLGVELDSASVRAAIQIAYKNNLITKKQKENIQGFEILRGDNSVSKSVIANGIAFDMYNYEKEGDTIHFSNFPFNDLGNNKFLTTQKFGNSLISHPFGSSENHLFSFISPDLFLNKPQLPTEAVIQGYLVGASKQQFVSSDEHSEWTVLGDKARRTAERLAIAEVALEFITNVANFMTQGGQGHVWFFGGPAGGGSSTVGAGVSTGATVTYALAEGIQGLTKVGKYRYEWLKVFRDLGATHNFASMQVGVGNYNKILTIDQYSESYLRKLSAKKYIKDGYATIVDENNGNEYKINNKSRESSAFISFGENFKIKYDPTYKSIDNNILSSTSSNFTSSDIGGVDNKYFTRNVASPYIMLKNYIPDQWGEIDSIKWLTTNYIFDINEPTACNPIYGGTHVISRFSWRRKVPMFRKNAIKHADKQPFMYSRYDNVAYPRFYCDYELSEDDNMWQKLGLPYPDINSNFNFDSESPRNRMYMRPPSKFYTSIHGIVDFLVESEINCNFRYARKDPKDWFYPQAQDLDTWLQEATLPMSEPNTFFYNTAYTLPVTNAPFKTLPKTYNKEVWKKLYNQPNALLWSQKDVTEGDTINPWRVYKPLDWYEFKTSNGDLIDLHNIESNQFLARFENSLKMHNAIDNIAERITPENKELGVAGMFMQRPMEFKSTDLGFMGTQNTSIVSTPYGHFWCDAKRGKVFKLDQNGQGLEIISEIVNGKPSGMKSWFREHLPFKILKYIPNLDIDNNYKGLGLNMWWDDRESRVFITKRDYVPKVTCLEVEGEDIFSVCEENSCTSETNLVVNGDFDTSLNGWLSQYPVEESFSWSDGKAWFGDANDQNPSIYQNILEEGKTYKISFDMYINPDCNFVKYVKVYAGTTQSQQFTVTGDSRVDITLTCAGSERFAIEMWYGCGSDGEYKNNTISIDNVCVVEQAANREKIDFSNSVYFEDVSWTISFKPAEGTWNSYFTFYPDYSTYHNNFFQTGYNWGEDRGTLWSHLMNKSSFCVFQGKKHKPILEFVIPNQNVTKILNSISLNVEGKYYVNDWDYTTDKDKSFKNMFIYNSTNNSGTLELIPQKGLKDLKNYPITNGNIQKILFTSENGKQNTNYFFNRVVNQANNIPMFITDKNNIFKQVNNSSVNFKGKKVLERLKGDYFIVHLEDIVDTRYNIILKNVISDETIISE